MSDWAKPGVQCVCINDDWGGFILGEHQVPVRLPMLNEVLTIVGVSRSDNGVFLWFEEIPTIQADGPLIADGIRWHVSHFRPLIKRKTDISIFTAMLTPAGRLPVDA